MSNSQTEDWSLLLSRLNSLIFRSDSWKSHLTPEILSAGWCGHPPASEESLSIAERRLGIRLPPSYRSVLSIADGCYPFGSFIERLLPVGEVDWLRNADP